MKKKRKKRNKEKERKKELFSFFFFSVKALFWDANNEYWNAIELIYFIILLLSIEKIEF